MRPTFTDDDGKWYAVSFADLALAFWMACWQGLRGGLRRLIRDDESCTPAGVIVLVALIFGALYCAGHVR